MSIGRINRFARFHLTIGVLFGCGPASAATSCEQLIDLRIGNATIVDARELPVNTDLRLPAHCRVIAKIRPSPQSDVTVVVAMPTSTWNKKFLGTGNGGYQGEIVVDSFFDGLRRGYAVANSDKGAVPFSNDGRALAGHPQRWIDFGHRATNAMTVFAKEVIRAYYAMLPARSYFVGCSAGGHQALMEAQRYPNDYDGIVAAAPGHNRTHGLASFVWNFRAVSTNPPWPPVLLPRSTLSTVNRLVLAQCRQPGFDLPSDDYLSDPRACGFDPQVHVCNGANPGNCVTAAQAKALTLLYTGTRNPRTGRLIYPGIPKGSEINENLMMISATYELPFAPGVDLPLPAPPFEGLFLWNNSSWNPWRFDFDYDMKAIDDRFAANQNALNPDLSRFANRGGKLILYHGWSDAITLAQETINYYDEVVRANGGPNPAGLQRTQQFARLFLAPGMAHCYGGPGPGVVNGVIVHGVGADDLPSDVLEVLDRWVDRGVAPDTLLAIGVRGGARITRPLCAYPLRAAYVGPGSDNDAASFKCIDGGPVRNQVPVPEYRR